MGTTAGRSAIAFAAVAWLSISACGGGDGPPPDSASLAARAAAGMKVAEVQFGTAIGADMKVTAATLNFTVRDTVHIAVSTTGAMRDASLLLLVKPAGDSTIVHSEGRTISASGPLVTTFRIGSPEVLRPGRYSVEIFLNGGLADIKGFEVVR